MQYPSDFPPRPEGPDHDHPARHPGRRTRRGDGRRPDADVRRDPRPGTGGRRPGPPEPGHRLRLYVPITDVGDGIASVQPFDDQVFVQLFSGVVVAVQAEDNPRSFHKAGDVIWTFRPSQPPGVVRRLAVSPTEVYLVDGQRLVLLRPRRREAQVLGGVGVHRAGRPGGGQLRPVHPARQPPDRGLLAHGQDPRLPPAQAVRGPGPAPPDHLANPAEALSTPQNRSPSIAPLEILAVPPVGRDDRQQRVGRYAPHPPPAVPGSRDDPVAVHRPAATNLRNIYELNSKEAPTRIQYLWELVAPGRVTDTPILTVDPADPTSERITSSAGRVIFTALREAPRTNNISTEYIAEAAISGR